MVTLEELDRLYSGCGTMFGESPVTAYGRKLSRSDQLCNDDEDWICWSRLDNNSPGITSGDCWVGDVSSEEGEWT